MRVSNVDFRVRGGIAVMAAACLALVALCACGTSPNTGIGGYGSSSGGGSGVGTGSGSSGGVILGDAQAGGSGGTIGCLTCIDAGMPVVDAGPDAPPMQTGPAPAINTHVPYSDCGANCAFPALTAPACAASAPAITIKYPNDTVLLPPNMNTLSVQWTPFGPPFTRYEVDFSQSLQDPKTDWRIITSCASQTQDMQPYNANGASVPAPSGGCEITIDPFSWSALVGANRGNSNPLAVTVRGTTDGVCASSSNTIHISFAEEDLIGTYYYWQSFITTSGMGGFIWAKAFGDLNTPEVNVTPNGTNQAPFVYNGKTTLPTTLNATCNGCHSLARDGSRMVVYSDDADSDDEYSDMAGSLLDMTPLFANAPTEFANTGITGARQGGQPPGFTAINPQATHYVTSLGYGPQCAAGGNACGTANPYPAPVALGSWSLWDATNGNFVSAIAVDPAATVATRPTMPDWSIDGTKVVYVKPVGDFKTVGPTAINWRDDDAHVYGGSLYTVDYAAGVFTNPTPILPSAGENNYYPSFSPDSPMGTGGAAGLPSFIIFDRVASMGAAANCVTMSSGLPTNGAVPHCLDDSFSNPAARLWLMQTPSAANPMPPPIDLAKANGSTDPWSNSYPRWAPFVQSYHGNKILWFTFSSTRDYGVRILNHKTGMYQCYPADSAENSVGTAKGHGTPFNGSAIDPSGACQEPQLWMAPLTFTEAQSGTADPSGVAFWLPYQKMTSHNHTAQWTWIPNQPPPVGQPPPPMPCMCSTQGGQCGAANTCGCCGGQGLVCTGSGICIKPPA